MLSSRSLAYGVAAALAGAVVSMGGASLVFGLRWPAGSVAIVAAALIVCQVFHEYAVRSDEALARAGISFVVVVLALSLAGTLGSLWFRQEYGDSSYLLGVIESGRPFSRWLAGSAILTWAYAAVWKFPVVAARLPGPAGTLPGFVCLTGSLCMAAAAVVAFRMRRAPMAVYTTVTGTMWVVFSLGYIEYYPFIAGSVLLVLTWVQGLSADHVEPKALGIVVGLLASLYVGFWPLAVIVGGTFALAAPRRNWPIVAWAVATFLCCVRVFWPESPSQFFSTLWSDMNLGEKMIPPGYAGLAAGPTSVYFKTAYVLSRAHMHEIGYELFFSGTLVPLALLLGAAGMAAWRAARRRPGRGMRAPAIVTAVALAYYLRYFLWKIPKLGLPRDIDLYFTFYVIVTFALGLLLETRGAGRLVSPAGRYVVLSLLTGAAIPICYVVVVRGLPGI